MYKCIVLFPSIILLMTISCENEKPNSNKQIDKEKNEINSQTDKDKAKDLYKYIDKFVSGELDYSLEQNRINELENKYKGISIEVEGIIWTVYPYEIGLTIKENKIKNIIVGASCQIGNAESLFKVNQAVKLKGTIKEIIISSDPIGTIILNFLLDNCEKIS